MLRWILLLFIAVPLLELYLLLWLATLITFWPTVAIVLVTGTLGGMLAKREGLKVWRDWNASLRDMSAPKVGIIDGLLVLIGGALLITPGILTDLVGFSLLVPWTRRPIAARLRSEVERRLASGNLGVFSVSTVGGPGSGSFPGGGFPGAGFPGAGFPGDGFPGDERPGGTYVDADGVVVTQGEDPDDDRREDDDRPDAPRLPPGDA